ncbi:hypothetical protein ACFLYD_02450 [Chloroflexota bacterium]
MTTLEEIVNQLGSLTSESLSELARFVEYLKWKEGPESAQAATWTWSYDFVEHFRLASVTAEHGQAGMEVRVGEASCAGDSQMALWQHPPVQGSCIVEYQVPVPEDVSKLRLRFMTGIRDGSHLAQGNVVAFRVFVNGWKVWSDTQHAREWRSREVVMPSLPGDMARIQFVTDGLGNHQWAWAAWGAPRLVGEAERE